MTATAAFAMGLSGGCLVWMFWDGWPGSPINPWKSLLWGSAGKTLSQRFTWSADRAVSTGDSTPSESWRRAYRRWRHCCPCCGCRGFVYWAKRSMPTLPEIDATILATVCQRHCLRNSKSKPKGTVDSSRAWGSALPYSPARLFRARGGGLNQALSWPIRSRPP